MTKVLAIFGAVMGALVLLAIISFLALDFIACGMGMPDGIFC